MEQIVSAFELKLGMIKCLGLTNDSHVQITRPIKHSQYSFFVTSNFFSTFKVFIRVEAVSLMLNVNNLAQCKMPTYLQTQQ